MNQAFHIDPPVWDSEAPNAPDGEVNRAERANNASGTAIRETHGQRARAAVMEVREERARAHRERQSGTGRKTQNKRDEDIMNVWVKNQALKCEDADILKTNNSSIVSKRSVERTYLPRPHFIRHFVKKPHRRSPLIHRGYWLRMHAIEQVVLKFLDEPSTSRKFILNLGCG
ncbi:MAG: hypothetical protein Q9183_002243 [Haloplaca sp. 2 TL-2023]